MLVVEDPKVLDHLAAKACDSSFGHRYNLGGLLVLDGCSRRYFFPGAKVVKVP